MRLAGVGVVLLLACASALSIRTASSIARNSARTRGQLVPKRSDLDENVEFVVMCDIPDFDNYAMITSAYVHLAHPSKTTLHVLLTGRPIDLKAKPTASDPHQLFPQGTPRGELTDIPPIPFGLENPPDLAFENERPGAQDFRDADAVLEAGASRYRWMLRKYSGIEENVVFYKGGIAPHAPMSDFAHQEDFLLDRLDIVKGQSTCPSDHDRAILNFHEMKQARDNFWSLPSAEARRNALLRCKDPHLREFDDFVEHFRNSGEEKQFIFLVGGPMTPLKALYDALGEDHAMFVSKTKEIHAMFGNFFAKSNIFKNQFNFDADIDAGNWFFGIGDYKDAGVPQLFAEKEGFRAVLTPTEATKDVRDITKTATGFNVRAIFKGALYTWGRFYGAEDSDTSACPFHRAYLDYMAVWKCPSKEGYDTCKLPDKAKRVNFMFDVGPVITAYTTTPAFISTAVELKKVTVEDAVLQDLQDLGAMAKPKDPYYLLYKTIYGEEFDWPSLDELEPISDHEWKQLDIAGWAKRSWRTHADDRKAWLENQLRAFTIKQSEDGFFLSPVVTEDMKVFGDDATVQAEFEKFIDQALSPLPAEKHLSRADV